MYLRYKNKNLNTLLIIFSDIHLRLQKKSLLKNSQIANIFFVTKVFFIDPFKMIIDSDFESCGFVKPYFAITAQRQDEIIVTFEKGLFFCFFLNKKIKNKKSYFRFDRFSWWIQYWFEY